MTVSEKTIKNSISILILYVFSCGNSIGSNTDFNIPEEFRSLWEEQEEVYEVRLYGESLGVHKTKVTPVEISFPNPEGIINNIKGTLPRKEELLQLLNNKYPRNDVLSCQGMSSEGTNCNFIKTDTVTVIVDDSEGVINLFIDKNYMPENKNKDDNGVWSVTSDTDKAFVHNQIINATKSKNYKNLSLSGTGALGLSENSYSVFDWNGNYTESSNYNYNSKKMNGLYYRYEFQNRFYSQIGRMDSNDLSRREGGVSTIIYSLLLI